MSQQFCLKWNNHMNNMMDVFKNLLSTEAMVDVTLACDGLSLKAHKIVLSACSPFFQSLFLENPCKHPIVILKDMKYTELKAIIEFMYHGEVNVAQDQLSALMKTAETLRVKGLAEVTNEKNQSSSNDRCDESSHRVARTDTPPPKRRRGRTRKRSLSDQSDDGASEPKIKQPDSDIEELSGDMDPSTPYSTSSTVPLQSHTNSFHKSSQQEQPVEQSADESFAPEEKFGVEPSKLLEQTLTTDDLPRRSGRSSVQSNMELQRRPRSSTDHSSNLVPVAPSPMPSDALVVANQQPESPPDIKPELLDLEPPMSPVAGPSHSTDENSMMMYMDQSSMSTMPGPSGYQDNSALVSTDSQPQGIDENTSRIIIEDAFEIGKTDLLLFSSDESACISLHSESTSFSLSSSSIKSTLTGLGERSLCISNSDSKICSKDSHKPTSILHDYLLQRPTKWKAKDADAEKGNYKCGWESCDRCFMNEKDLVQHVNNMHIYKDENSLYRCHWNGCHRQGKTFNARYRMRIHIRSHTHKPYTCDGCGKKFARLENFKIHTRFLTEGKPYACPVAGCNKSYSSPTDRFKPSKTQQEDKPYICHVEGCGKRYTDPSSLCEYMKSNAHGGEHKQKSGLTSLVAGNNAKVSNAHKPYVCKFKGCNKRYTSLVSLRKHRRAASHVQDPNILKNRARFLKSVQNKYDVLNSQVSNGTIKKVTKGSEPSTDTDEL